MKRVFIVANWKANKTVAEARNWLQKLSTFNSQLSTLRNKEVIICPPFTLLSELASGIRNQKLRIRLGAQDVSPFEEGAYTGEVSARQIKEFADYVIIGHSERREKFKENSGVIKQKIAQALKFNLIPILCFSSVEQISDPRFVIPNSKLLVAYELLSAIGSGQPERPENADQVAATIKKELGDIPILYGGSVTSENVKNFTALVNIDGVLVGTASLDPQEFLRIVINA